MGNRWFRNYVSPNSHLGDRWHAKFFLEWRTGFNRLRCTRGKLIGIKKCEKKAEVADRQNDSRVRTHPSSLLVFFGLCYFVLSSRLYSDFFYLRWRASKFVISVLLNFSRPQGGTVSCTYGKYPTTVGCDQSRCNEAPYWVEDHPSFHCQAQLEDDEWFHFASVSSSIHLQSPPPAVIL